MTHPIWAKNKKKFLQAIIKHTHAQVTPTMQWGYQQSIAATLQLLHS